jgi:hypothetical protein
VFVPGARDAEFFNFERYVEACTMVADDRSVGPNKGVVNMSFGLSFGFASDAAIAWIWCKSPSAPDDNETNEWLTLTGNNRRTHGNNGGGLGHHLCSRRQLH